MTAHGVARSELSSVLTDPRARRVLDAVAGAGAFYFVLQLLWPAPLGVLVQGGVIGALTALVAFGLVLVYRANRVINFAQGDFGAAPATLAVLLIVGPGWPYVLAMPVGIAAGAVLGGLLEFLVIRRFFSAPRLILTVATIGLAQLLAGIGLLLPQLFDLTVPPQSFPSPFDASFEIHPIVFDGNVVMAMVAVPVMVAALAAFFRFTDLGVAVRASAESAERAALLGIPVKRVQTTVWVLAAVLSTVAMLLRAGIIGLPIGTVVGPVILLRALAAGVIGRMEKLPTVFVAAVALGMIEQSIIWHTGRSVLVAPILFAVVLGALLLQRRRRLGRADPQSSWQAAKAVRAVPRELARLPEIRLARRLLLVLGYGALVIVPLFLSVSRVNLLGAVLIFAMVGISLVVLTGWAGQISLGQMGFVGIGAAVAGALTTRLSWDPVLAIVIAGLVGAAVAVVIGLPALRMRGLFLAVTTLAFALATSEYFLAREFFDWWLPQGRIGRPELLGRIDVSSELRFYYFVLVLFIAMVAAAGRVRRSRTGRVLIATRENEHAARGFGVSATGAKLSAFAISGFFAAATGGLLVFHQQALPVNTFKPAESLQVFVMVVIGGLGSVPGAVLGAAYVRGITWFLPGEVQFLTSAVGVLLILMIAPGGLASVLYQLRDAVLVRVAERRGILVPSLQADAREFATVVAARQRATGSSSMPGVASEPDDQLPDAPLERDTPPEPHASQASDSVRATPGPNGNGRARRRRQPLVAAAREDGT